MPVTATRDTCHSDLRKLGHGWIVDLVEAGPEPCTCCARLDSASVEVTAELEWHGKIHSARELLSLEQLEESAGNRVAHVQRAIGRLSQLVMKIAADHETQTSALRAGPGVSYNADDDTG